MKHESVGYLHIESQGIGNVECPVLAERFGLAIFFEDGNKELEYENPGMYIDAIPK